MCKPCSILQKSKSKNNVKVNPKINIVTSSNSQLEMFKEIWNERPHVSQISGKLLVGQDHPNWVGQFEHVLPKGAFPKWKFNKNNIWLMTFEEHFDLTNNTHKCMKDSIFDEYFRTKQRFREQYNRIKD